MPFFYLEEGVETFLYLLLASGLVVLGYGICVWGVAWLLLWMANKENEKGWKFYDDELNKLAKRLKEEKDRK